MVVGIAEDGHVIGERSQQHFIRVKSFVTGWCFQAGVRVDDRLHRLNRQPLFGSMDDVSDVMAKLRAIRNEDCAQSITLQVIRHVAGCGSGGAADCAAGEVAASYRSHKGTEAPSASSNANLPCDTRMASGWPTRNSQPNPPYPLSAISTSDRNTGPTF